MNSVENIGQGQRQLRFWSALGLAFFTLAFAIFLVVIDAPNYWRLLIFIPLVAAVSSFLEARTSTCVALAMQDQCSMDKDFSVLRTLRGDRVQDDELARALRAKAYRIIAQGWGFAIAVTLIFFVMPI